MTLDFNPYAGKQKIFVSCRHENTRVVYGHYRSGSRKYREYCDDCGNFSEYGYTGCGLKKAIERYGSAMVDAARHESTAPIRDKRPNYREYIQSAEWFSKRNAAILRADGKCQISGCDRDAEQVHHRHYLNLGNERDEDLMAVCRDCHEKIHGVS